MNGTPLRRVKAGQDGEAGAWRVALHEARAGSGDVHVETRHSFSFRSKNIGDSEFGSVSKVYFSCLHGSPLRSKMLVKEHGTWQKHFDYHFGNCLQLVQF